MRIELNTRLGKKQQIFAFADTHGKHRQMTIPADVDTLVFAGDACEGSGQSVQEGKTLFWNVAAF
jgi:hypothetical protein